MNVLILIFAALGAIVWCAFVVILCMSAAVYIAEHGFPRLPDSDPFVELEPSIHCMDCGHVMLHRGPMISHGLCSVCQAARWEELRSIYSQSHINEIREEIRYVKTH